MCPASRYSLIVSAPPEMRTSFPIGVDDPECGRSCLTTRPIEGEAFPIRGSRGLVPTGVLEASALPIQ